MKRFVVVLALVALVAVNAVLLVAVLQQDRQSGLDVQTASSTPSSSPTNEEPPDATDLYAADDGALFQAARGSCTGREPVRLDVSTDGGTSFDEVALPLPDVGEDDTGEQQDTELVLRTVLAVDAESDTELVLAGNDAECRTRFFATDDGGETWDEREEFSAWYVPASGSEVQSPEGMTMPGCEARAVAAVSDANAKVLCSDGGVRGTNDAGETWAPFGALPGATALAFTSFSAGYAAAPDGDCTLRVFETGDAGESWDPLGCVSKEAEAGPLVLRGGQLVAGIGRGVRVSDDGDNWSRPGD